MDILSSHASGLWSEVETLLARQPEDDIVRAGLRLTPARQVGFGDDLTIESRHNPPEMCLLIYRSLNVNYPNILGAIRLCATAGSRRLRIQCPRNPPPTADLEPLTGHGSIEAIPYVLTWLQNGND